MTKTPAYTAKEIINLLERKGFVLDRTKGSHCIYRMPDGSKRVIVPCITGIFQKGLFIPF